MKTLFLLSLTTISAVLSLVALLGGEIDIATVLSELTIAGALIALIAVVQLRRQISKIMRETESLQASRTDIERQLQEERAQIETQLQEKTRANDTVQRSLRQELSEERRQREGLEREKHQVKAELQSVLAESQALRAKVMPNDAKSPKEAGDIAVLQFLRSLQERGRLLDFAMADILRLPDAQVGAAARVVHQGVKVVLQDYFDIQAISSDTEGSLVTIPADLEGHKFRIVSADSGATKGRLIHRGWQALSIRLPQSMPGASSSARIIAPAEIDAEGASL